MLPDRNNIKPSNVFELNNRGIKSDLRNQLMEIRLSINVQCKNKVSRDFAFNFILFKTNLHYIKNSTKNYETGYNSSSNKLVHLPEMF